VLQTDKLVVASIDKSSAVSISFDERQELKIIEDHILDIFVAFDSCLDTISSLLEKEKAYIAPRTTDQSLTLQDLDTTTLALLEMQAEVVLGKQKAQTLHMKVQNSTQLVSGLDEHYLI